MSGKYFYNGIEISTFYNGGSNNSESSIFSGFPIGNISTAYNEEVTYVPNYIYQTNLNYMVNEIKAQAPYSELKYPYNTATFTAPNWCNTISVILLGGGGSGGGGGGGNWNGYNNENYNAGGGGGGGGSGELEFYSHYPINSRSLSVVIGSGANDVGNGGGSAFSKDAGPPPNGGVGGDGNSGYSGGSTYISGGVSLTVSGGGGGGGGGGSGAQINGYGGSGGTSSGSGGGGGGGLAANATNWGNLVPGGVGGECSQSNPGWPPIPLYGTLPIPPPFGPIYLHFGSGGTGGYGGWGFTGQNNSNPGNAQASTPGYTSLPGYARIYYFPS